MIHFGHHYFCVFILNYYSQQKNNVCFQLHSVIKRIIKSNVESINHANKILSNSYKLLILTECRTDIKKHSTTKSCCKNIDKSKVIPKLVSTICRCMSNETET